jgi:hypothetical protein
MIRTLHIYLDAASLCLDGPAGWIKYGFGFATEFTYGMALDIIYVVFASWFTVEIENLLQAHQGAD